MDEQFYGQWTINVNFENERNQFILNDWKNERNGSCVRNEWTKWVVCEEWMNEMGRVWGMNERNGSCVRDEWTEWVVCEGWMNEMGRVWGMNERNGSCVRNEWTEWKKVERTNLYCLQCLLVLDYYIIQHNYILERAQWFNSDKLYSINFIL